MEHILHPGMSFPAEFPEGALLLIDKPLAWTSFDVVNKVRLELSIRLKKKKIKVGHAGTLDPLATGLLILCVGKYTKRIESLQGQNKTYTGSMTLGAVTDSYDLEKPVSKIFPTNQITPELLETTLESFRGHIQQVPPIYSAIKVDGKRVYKNARTGENVEIEPREVEVFRFEAGPFKPVVSKVSEPRRLNDRGAPIMLYPDHTEGTQFDFEIECGKGTYIRSLAHDLGDALGCGAYLSSLRRTQNGEYSVEDAWSLESLIECIRS